MRVIGFTGQAKCGKTTLCQQIEEDLDPDSLDSDVQIRSFAAPLKAAVEMLGGHKHGTPEQQIRYRLLCQHVGAFLRNPDSVPGITGPNFFVNVMREELDKIQQVYDEEGIKVVVLIDDVRYENERALIHEFDGDWVFLNRLDLPEPDAEWRQHHSEHMANFISQALQDSSMMITPPKLVYTYDLSSTPRRDLPSDVIHDLGLTP